MADVGQIKYNRFIKKKIELNKSIHIFNMSSEERGHKWSSLRPWRGAAPTSRRLQAWALHTSCVRPLVILQPVGRVEHFYTFETCV